jgi:uncharacterized protein YcfJ
MSKAGARFGPASGQKDKGATIMLKKIIISTVVAASALTALPAAAEAQSRYGYSNRYDNGNYAQRYGGYYNQGQRYDRRYANQRYNNQRYYNHYGQRCSGSTGTIIGAIAGGLLGNEVAGRGDRTLGAIIGAGAGALAGRAIDRSDCR